MKIRKLIFTIAATVLAISAVPMTANAADYPDGQIKEYDRYTINYGDSSKAIVKPVLTIDIDGKGNQVVYDDVSEIAGKTVTCSLNVSGAAFSYASTGIHIYYDSRFESVPNAKGKPATAGEAISWTDPVTGKHRGIMPSTPKYDPTAPDGFSGFFTACAGEDDDGRDGTMWTFTLKIPDDAQKGDVFPIDIIYRNGGAEDLFINKACDENGYNMQAYAFTKGIFNSKNPNGFNQSENVAKVAALKNICGDMDAYIAIADEPPVTTTTTVTTTSTTTTTTTIEQPSLEIEKSEVTLAIGEQFTIKSNQSDLTYESNDKDIATVSKSGVITAKKAGNAVIFISNKDEDTAVLKVTVVSNKPAAKKYGDANGDGDVTVADAVAIMQFLGNKDKYDLSAEAKANADCFNTGDGITGNDALTIQKVDAGLIKLEDLPIKN